MPPPSWPGPRTRCRPRHRPSPSTASRRSRPSRTGRTPRSASAAAPAALLPILTSQAAGRADRGAADGRRLRHPHRRPGHRRWSAPKPQVALRDGNVVLDRRHAGQHQLPAGGQLRRHHPGAVLRAGPAGHQPEQQPRRPNSCSAAAPTGCGWPRSAGSSSARPRCRCNWSGWTGRAPCCCRRTASRWPSAGTGWSASCSRRNGMETDPAGGLRHRTCTGWSATSGRPASFTTSHDRGALDVPTRARPPPPASCTATTCAPGSAPRAATRCRWRPA